MNQDISPEKIMQIGMGFWMSKVVLSAVELGVFTELAEGPLDAKELAKKINIQERGALDFFDSLVSAGMLQRTDGKYSNAPDTNIFLDKAKPSYIGGILEMANIRLYPSWGKLTVALRTGESQDGTKGFHELYEDPERVKLFAKAMTGVSLGANKVISEKFPWKKYKTFIDIGTAEGGLPVQLALAHPHLTGIGLDLPSVKPFFDKYVASFNLSSRIKFHSCDIFKEDIPSADVVILGHMLHGMNLEKKKALLKKVYDILPKGGSIIVFEALIDDERRKNTFGLLMSLNMLVETEGGFDYTCAQCIEWLKETGFTGMEIIPLVGPNSIAIGIK